MNLYDAHQTGNQIAIRGAEERLLVAVYRENGWNRHLFAVEPPENKARRQAIIAELRDLGYD